MDRGSPQGATALMWVGREFFIGIGKMREDYVGVSLKHQLAVLMKRPSVKTELRNHCSLALAKVPQALAQGALW